MTKSSSGVLFDNSLIEGDFWSGAGMTTVKAEDWIVTRQSGNAMQ